MMFEFNYQRSLEAAAYLLRLHSGSMNYMRLLKLLYIAERELLVETAAPLTGDCYKAMDNGPVLSMVYDHIMKRDWTNPEWHTHIEKIPNYRVKLAADPGEGHLSKVITDKLVAVTERYKHKDHWAIVDVTHDFPEWVKNKPSPGSSNLIPLEDILEAMGEGPETLAAIQEDEIERQQMNQLFDNLQFENSPEGEATR